MEGSRPRVWTSQSGTLPRSATLDVLRGLNVVLMVLMNDLSTVRDAPAWAKHAPAGVEGLTFVDVIFPLFVFLVGATVPLALSRRSADGAPPLRTGAHVLLRTAALVLAGVFLVNMPMAAEATMGMAAALWSLLVLLSLIGLFHEPPAQAAWRWPSRAARLLAMAALLLLALRYRGLDGDAVVALRPLWWGILGLLGWAYLCTCLVYLLLRPLRARFTALLGLIALSVVLQLAERAGGLDRFGAAWRLIAPLLGPCTPLALSGLWAGLLLLPESQAPTPRERVRWLLPLAVGLCLAGLGLRSLHPISKPTATPSYVLVCAGLCCLIFLLGDLLLDGRPVPRPARWLQRVGQGALLVYLLPGVLYALIDLWRRGYLETRFPSGWPGGLRSLLFTAAVLAVFGLLRRAHLRLRL